VSMGQDVGILPIRDCRQHLAVGAGPLLADGLMFLGAV
jgi:hypothetical protein